MGAPGSESVFACAVGISSAVKSAVAVASAPQPWNLRDAKLCFLPESNQIGDVAPNASISRGFLASESLIGPPISISLCA